MRTLSSVSKSVCLIKKCENHCKFEFLSDTQVFKIQTINYRYQKQGQHNELQ